jgi:hypothetical protein
MMKSLQPADQQGDPIEGADCVGLILASELGAFFSSEGFLETMATHVTSLNDAPHGRYDPDAGAFRARTYKMKFIRWEQDLLNPCIGMLAATTPTGMARELPQQAQTAGLFGRMLCVWQSVTDREPNALVDQVPRSERQRLAGLEEALLEGLQKMAELRGEMAMSAQAREAFRDWYLGHVAQHKGSGALSEAGYIGRKADHALRVAMVLSAMELAVGAWPPERLLVKEGHVRTALSWLGRLEPGFERAIGETQAARRTTLADVIFGYLVKPRQRGRWISRRQIQQRVWYRCQSGKELRAALENLVEVGKLRTREAERNQVFYRARKASGITLAEEGR